jgi:hypothetical protein
MAVVSKIQTISSIIGSGFFLFAINTLYTDLINKPDIHVQLISSNDLTSIQLSNNGRVPATHLVLTIQAPSRIVKHQVFSTENWTNSINQTSMRIYFPGLVQGDGSIAKISVDTDKNLATDRSSFMVYLTYDQGSLKIIGGVQEASPPFGLTVFLIIMAISSFLIPYLYTKTIRVFYSQTVTNIAKEIMEFKRHFESNPYDGAVHDVKPPPDYMIKIFNSDERRLIENFYEEFESRNNILGSQRSSATPDNTKNVGKLNNQIIRRAKDVFEKIDWRKYNINKLDLHGKREGLKDPRNQWLTMQKLARQVPILLGIPICIIVMIPIWSVYSYIISRNALQWTVKFEIGHWIISIAILVLIIYFQIMSRRLQKAFTGLPHEPNMDRLYNFSFVVQKKRKARTFSPLMLPRDEI